MKFSTALKLGRVSNLPTVLSNILVGIGLASSASLTVNLGVMAIMTLVVSLIYIGGMYLNDAVDAEFDKQFNPTRPIAAGEVGYNTVLFLAVGMLAAAMGILLVFDLLNGNNFRASIYGLILILCVVAYDLIHKKMRIGPWVMGACRFMVYLLAASVVSSASGDDKHIIFVAASVYAYVVGLTYMAKTEHLNQAQNYWPLVLFFMPMIYFGYHYILGNTGAWSRRLACSLPGLGCLSF